MAVYKCRSCCKVSHAAGERAPSCPYCGGTTRPYATSALAAGQKIQRRLVYICTAQQGEQLSDTERLKLLDICRRVALQNAIPVAPGLYYPEFLDQEKAYERRVGLELDHTLLLHCSELWIFGHEITSTMQAKIAAARNHGLTVQSFDQ